MDLSRRSFLRGAASCGVFWAACLFALLAAFPLMASDRVVRGHSAPDRAYAPPAIGNGELSLSIDWTFGMTRRKYPHFSPGTYLAGRRTLHPHKELFCQGYMSTVLEIDGKRQLAPIEWTQELDVDQAEIICDNVYSNGIRMQARAFVPLFENTLIIRQTFRNEGDSQKDIRAGICWDRPANVRMSGRWTALSDGGARYLNRTYGFDVIDSVTDLVPCQPASAASFEDGAAECAQAFLLAPGEARHFVWFVVFADTMDEDGRSPADRAAERAARLKRVGWEALVADHCAAWAAYYSESEVSMPDAQLMSLRKMAEYHLRINATRWSFPTGIFASHWHGHYFAFDEMYMFEGLASSGHLSVSRRVPEFRFATLPVARQVCSHYRKPGKYGARWYWQSGETLPSDVVVEAATPGFWLDHVFHMANIARCAALQYRYTNDRRYLETVGYPVILECARFFRNNCVYELTNDVAVVRKCTDLERLGPSVDRPFMTTCGAIHALRLAADASDILVTNCAEAADFRLCAERLVRGLPQREGRYIAHQTCAEESVGQVAGFSPYPIFPPDHEPQRKAVLAYMANSSSSGNMYPGGKGVCAWYAAKVALALQMMGESTASFAWLEKIAETRGLFGEYWEINEKGVKQMHPWFATAAGTALSAINGMFVTENEKEMRLGCGVPPSWKDWSFRLPTQQGVAVDMRVRDGRVEKLLLIPVGDAGDRSLTIVLPERFSPQPIKVVVWAGEPLAIK